MKIYVLMCLGDLVGDKFYTNEKEVIKEVEIANANMGGDFWYKTLTELKRIIL